MIAEPQKKYSLQHPHQVSITDALVCFIAEDLVPLSVMDSIGGRIGGGGGLGG